MATYAGITDGESQTLTDATQWSALIFGRYDINAVLEAVADHDWQLLRLHMKGRSLAERKRSLEEYLCEQQHSQKAKIQVTNYVYALKRGGLIK